MIKKCPPRKAGPSPKPGKPRSRRPGLAGYGTLLALCLTLFLIFAPAVRATEGEAAQGSRDSDMWPFSLINDLVGESVDGMTTTVEITLLLTVLTLAPSILIMTTSFTRIIIVLSFTRNAMGTQQMPPNQVLIGLALFLTYFTMFGTISDINERAWTPYNEGVIDAPEAYSNAVESLRTFMFEQIHLKENEKDLRMFLTMAELEAQPADYNDIPTHVLIPAFITSELKTAFSMGFTIFLPFIVLDMIVASALMSMGMMMLPPAMISLPFKLMIFVLVNGWDLVIESVVGSFR